MMRENSKPLARLQQVFPYELQENRAAYELKLDSNAKIFFIPLEHGLAIQLWQPGQAKDGHGYLLAGSGMLSEAEADRLIDSLVLHKRVA